MMYITCVCVRLINNSIYLFKKSIQKINNFKFPNNRLADIIQIIINNRTINYLNN